LIYREQSKVQYKLMSDSKQKKEKTEREFSCLMTVLSFECFLSVILYIRPSVNSH